jgi:hypothetical protein
MKPPSFFSRQSRPAVLAILAALCAIPGASFAPAAAAGVQPGDRIAYVLLHPGSRSSTMSGSMEDVSRARALRNGSEALLYFREGDAAYVIRDAATLRRAQEIFEPQVRLGARQAELGSRQAALGGRQAALGAQQARLGALQANATPRRSAELGREQGALGEQQNALGEQQNKLGAQQAVLGREQARLAREADVRFRDLVADARRRGVAQRIN